MAGLGDQPRAHVELADVSKHFGAVRALDAVSLSIARGSIHALVGENGAGKSTLGKIVAGVLAPDEGRLLLDGEEVALRSPREALVRGVATIAQEVNVVGQLTVEENVFLGVEPRGAGFVSRRALRRRYEQLAETPASPPGHGARRAAGRPPSSRRSRSCARWRATPSSSSWTSRRPRWAPRRPPSCTRSSARWPRAGRTVLLVSHFLREVLALADEVTVLRDGRVVRTAPAAEQTEDSLIHAMLGRPLTAAFPPKRAAPDDAPAVLTVRDLHAPRVEGVSLTVRAGEIVALAGLVGAGRTELARAIFGAERPTAGSVELARRRAVGRPAGAAARGRGDDPRVAQGGRAAARSLGHRERLAGQPGRASAATGSCAAAPSAGARARRSSAGRCAPTAPARR